MYAGGLVSTVALDTFMDARTGTCAGRLLDGIVRTAHWCSKRGDTQRTPTGFFTADFLFVEPVVTAGRHDVADMMWLFEHGILQL